jgi:hypothetical protein
MESAAENQTLEKFGRFYSLLRTALLDTQRRMSITRRIARRMVWIEKIVARELFTPYARLIPLEPVAQRKPGIAGRS